MAQLLQWMTCYKDDLKFVVTSVPFIAQINDAASTQTVRWQEQSSGGNPANDKWSAERFRRQREAIIDHIATEGIEHLVFLTGDMHCCYHAAMRIGNGDKYECITVHELAGGPANQLQLAHVSEFDTLHNGRTRQGRIPYEITLDGFHGEVNAVLHLKVDYPRRRRVLRSDQRLVPEIEWHVVRTLTDNDAAAWRTARAANKTEAYQEPSMGGRITFVKKRRPGDLRRWDRKSCGDGHHDGE